MNYESLLELVKNRRSIRRFKPDPIPDEYVDKIIEAARWAPSGFNSQPWEFVVVKKQELKDRIVQLIDEYNAHEARMASIRISLATPSQSELECPMHFFIRNLIFGQYLRMISSRSFV